MQGAETDLDLVEVVDSAILEGRQTGIEYVTYSKSGTKFWSSLSIMPIRSDDGTLKHFVGAELDSSREGPPPRSELQPGCIIMVMYFGLHLNGVSISSRCAAIGEPCGWS